MSLSSTKQLSNSARGVSGLEEIVRTSGWQKILRCIQQRRPWLDEVHIQLTQIPAPTFHEAARASFMAEQFRQLGLERVRTDPAGNILGERKGAANRLVCLTAHLDTVVAPGTPVQVKRNNGRWYAPGISDNGAGLAALLGAIAALQESGLQTELSLLFAANVGEEGDGDLCGMKHLFSSKGMLQRTAGVLVVDGSAVEQITTTGLGSRRFLVQVSGPGGHSWNDFGRVNPIHVLAFAIRHLSQVALPENPRTSFNIGMIQGGTAVNCIPCSASMKVDIRSTSDEEMEKLSRDLETAVQRGVQTEMQRGSGTLSAQILPMGVRPSAELAREARLLRVIQEVDQHLGIRNRLHCSSTDANLPLSLGIEAVATGGGGSGGDAHTPQEWYDPRGRELGLKRIVLALLLLAAVAEPC